MVKNYCKNQVTLLQENTGVTLYGEAAQIIELIAVSTVLILALAKIAKALQ